MSGPDFPDTRGRGFLGSCSLPERPRENERRKKALFSWSHIPRVVKSLVPEAALGEGQLWLQESPEKGQCPECLSQAGPGSRAAPSVQTQPRGVPRGPECSPCTREPTAPCTRAQGRHPFVQTFKHSGLAVCSGH